jgi:hypothetical protein
MPTMIGPYKQLRSNTKRQEVRVNLTSGSTRSGSEPWEHTFTIEIHTGREDGKVLQIEMTPAEVKDQIHLWTDRLLEIAAMDEAYEAANALRAGVLLQLPENTIPSTYMRGGKRCSSPASRSEIPAGRYVVRDADVNLEPERLERGVRIAAADWNEDGQLTFDSSKHHYIVFDRESLAMFTTKAS